MHREIRTAKHAMMLMLPLSMRGCVESLFCYTVFVISSNTIISLLYMMVLCWYLVYIALFDKDQQINENNK